MKKTLSAILILTLMVLVGCAHQPPPVQPPPPEPPRGVAPPLPAPRQALAPAPRERMKTELLLMGTLPPSSSESLEQVVNKKKAIYQALKGLGGKNSILIVYDASGSMRERIGETKTKKFEAAFEGLTRIGTLFGPDDHVWLFVFGSKKPFGLSSEGILYRKDYVRAMEAAEDVGLIYDSSKKGFSQNDFQAAIQFLEVGKGLYRGYAHRVRRRESPSGPEGGAECKGHPDQRRCRNGSHAGSGCFKGLRVGATAEKKIHKL